LVETGLTLEETYKPLKDELLSILPFSNKILKEGKKKSETGTKIFFDTEKLAMGML
jgi:hypothetical protein